MLFCIIPCSFQKNPPSLQCSTFESGDEVRQQSRWHFLCPSVNL
nr:MAG TPA: hypothetical protein [Caudoviricetes sp.]